MSDQQQAPQAVRAGSRWYDAPPDEDEIRDWFRSQPLHDGMDHNRYVSGIVIIPATEKVKLTQYKQNGEPFTVERERAVFTPYVKVDMRIAYFWDLIRTMNGMWRADQSDPQSADHHHYIGVIEPVPVKKIDDNKSPFFNGHLPDGYFLYPVRNNTNTESINRYIGCRWRVAIYERESYAESVKGRDNPPIIQGIGTKQTLQSKTYADDNALMKSETSAIGRALGVAGILVVGTGVATAEDMQEAQAPSGAEAAGTAQPVTLPPVVAPQGIPDDEQPTAEMVAADVGQDAVTPQEDDDRLRLRAQQLSQSFRQAFPEEFELYKAWWAERYEDTTLMQLSGPALKGAVRKLERDFDAAKIAAGV